MTFDYTFNKKTGHVTITEGSTKIPSHAFYGDNIKSVTIPETVTAIRWSAFEDNKLAEVVIPDSVTKITSVCV